MDSNAGVESTIIRYEWTLRGLGELFDGSKGDTKSKVTKSARFGGARWQILFYANSGTVNAEGQGYISLYLSCEPTSEEREKAVDGKWVREGVYKFGFELYNLQKSVLFNNKEASDHSFSYKTVNWGWAQFARREAVFQYAGSVKQNDAFLIRCTITSSFEPPVPLPTVAKQSVPRGLLDAMGDLLDDPDYSDVAFVIPRRRGNGRARTIYAARKLLKRVEYFDTMFRSGFLEGIQADRLASDMDDDYISVPATPFTLDGTNDDDVPSVGRFEDSDDEDDEIEDSSVESCLELRLPESPRALKDSRPSSWALGVEGEQAVANDLDESQGRNVRSKTSHPSSPREHCAEVTTTDRQLQDSQAQTDSKIDTYIPGPTKIKVVVRDVAYSTYRSVLNYIYTDTIAFAPLASTFHDHHLQVADPASNIGLSFGKLRGQLNNNLSTSTPAATATEGQTFPLLSNQRASLSLDETPALKRPTSRRAWIVEWEKNNPGRPRPCSAKAVYRLADRLGLQELKERSFQQIIKSLTVDNVAYEVFSDFSAAFEDVRKVEVAFFLEHWSEIRGSGAMRNVWQQIRLGRHPGFEEVWPLIALNLEFKPASSDAQDGASGEKS
ncbi:hypothetical protein BDW22DRAFT_1336950 [Trametopsis cervina]|nr:hypothetical protein BDW22DRAFT_1336950 [Trametopsis cervina]